MSPIRNRCDLNALPETYGSNMTNVICKGRMKFKKKIFTSKLNFLLIIGQLFKRTIMNYVLCQVAYKSPRVEY